MLYEHVLRAANVRAVQIHVGHCVYAVEAQYRPPPRRNSRALEAPLIDPLRILVFRKVQQILVIERIALEPHVNKALLGAARNARGDVRPVLQHIGAEILAPAALLRRVVERPDPVQTAQCRIHRCFPLSFRCGAPASVTAQPHGAHDFRSRPEVVRADLVIPVEARFLAV